MPTYANTYVKSDDANAIEAFCAPFRSQSDVIGPISAQLAYDYEEFGMQFHTPAIGDAGWWYAVIRVRTDWPQPVYNEVIVEADLETCTALCGVFARQAA